jgi:HTH-type transcriptional regulator / antitoxin HigA
MAMRKPAEVFPPGEFLREELEARGWTQADLAAIMGRPAHSINQIVVGKRGISAEMAQGLAAALGTSPEFWMNLDTAYQLGHVRRADSDIVARRARLYTLAPVKEMLSRGWIEPSDDVDVLERQVWRFLGMSGPDDTLCLPSNAARKGTSYEAATPAHRAWLCRARQLAPAVQATTFSKGNLEQALAQLSTVADAADELCRVPRILSEAGIRFLVVEPLAGTRIDGACFWLGERSPVVVVSLRCDRIDNFWFVLMHELGHLSAGEDLLIPDTDLESGATDPARSPHERQADKFALEHLVPPKEFRTFVGLARPLYSSRQIEAFAKVMNLHPGIVVGQLRHHGEVGRESFRKLLVPIRDRITATALSDGWGTVVATPSAMRACEGSACSS